MGVRFLNCIVVLVLLTNSTLNGQDLNEFAKRKFFWDGRNLRTVEDMKARSRLEESFDRGLCADWLLAAWSIEKGVNSKSVCQEFLAKLSSKCDGPMPPAWWSKKACLLLEDKVSAVEINLPVGAIVIRPSEKPIKLSNKAIIKLDPEIENSERVILAPVIQDVVMLLCLKDGYCRDHLFFLDRRTHETRKVASSNLFPSYTPERLHLNRQEGDAEFDLGFRFSVQNDVLFYYGFLSGRLCSGACSWPDCKRIWYFEHCDALANSILNLDSPDPNFGDIENAGHG